MNLKKMFNFTAMLTLLSSCLGGELPLSLALTQGNGNGTTPEIKVKITPTPSLFKEDSWVDISGVKVTLKREAGVVKKVLVENKTIRTLYIKPGSWYEKTRNVVVDPNSSCFLLENTNQSGLGASSLDGVKSLGAGEFCSLDILRDDPRYPVSKNAITGPDAYTPLSLRFSDTSDLNNSCSINLDVNYSFKPFVLYAASDIIDLSAEQKGVSAEDFYLWQKSGLDSAECNSVKDMLGTPMGRDTWNDVAGVRITLHRTNLVVDKVTYKNNNNQDMYINYRFSLDAISPFFPLYGQSTCLSLHTVKVESYVAVKKLPAGESCSLVFSRNYHGRNLATEEPVSSIGLGLGVSNNTSIQNISNPSCFLYLDIRHDFQSFQNTPNSAMNDIISPPDAQEGFSSEDYGLWDTAMLLDRDGRCSALYSDLSISNPLLNQ